MRIAACLVALTATLATADPMVLPADDWMLGCWQVGDPKAEFVALRVSRLEDGSGLRVREFRPGWWQAAGGGRSLMAGDRYTLEIRADKKSRWIRENEVGWQEKVPLKRTAAGDSVIVLDGKEDHFEFRLDAAGVLSYFRSSMARPARLGATDCKAFRE